MTDMYYDSLGEKGRKAQLGLRFVRDMIQF